VVFTVTGEMVEMDAKPEECPEIEDLD
jgi:hypothetical protein